MELRDARKIIGNSKHFRKLGEIEINVAFPNITQFFPLKGLQHI